MEKNSLPAIPLAPEAFKQESCTVRCISFSWEATGWQWSVHLRDWAGKECLSGWLWTLPTSFVSACLLACSSFNEENKGKHFSWRQRARGVPRWQLARTTNSERICVPMWNTKIKRLLIKSFKHGNYNFMEKRIAFHRMAYVKCIALTGETTVYTVFCWCAWRPMLLSTILSQPGVLCLTRIKSVVNKSVLIKGTKSTYHHLMRKLYNH